MQIYQIIKRKKKKRKENFYSIFYTARESSQTTTCKSLELNHNIKQDTRNL